MAELKLSVVIPCSRPGATARCLEGFSNQIGESAFEVIVVGDVRGISNSYPRFELQLIPCEERHANVRRNIGISHARARLIGFIDDDAVPEKHWVMVAVSLDPDARKILTGPEKPLAFGETSDLIFAVSQNWLAEGTRAHVNRKRESVSWTEVPFCNCVVPRHVLDTVGMPAIDIPWDMDDFEFCFRARSEVCFENVPELAIRHDRYPDSIVKFIRYKGYQRARTGEKLISHPWIYARLWSVIVCAVIPWVMLLSLLLSPISVASTVMIMLFCYGMILASQLPLAARRYGILGSGSYLSLMLALHITTVVGLQVGVVRGCLAKVGLADGLGKKFVRGALT